MGAEGRLLPRDRRPPEGGRGPLGELLHAHRRTRNETMRTVGERCGLKSGYLSFIERGMIMAPNPASVTQLAEGYQIGQDQIEAAIAAARGQQADGRAVSPRIRISRELHEAALADAVRYQEAMLSALGKKGRTVARDTLARDCQAALTRYRQAQSAMQRR